MPYNIQHLSTAGRATIFTILFGVGCFLFAFLINLGSDEFKQAVAQSDVASTSVTVVNLPPYYFLDAREVTESSTSSPTNSGDVVSFEAIAIDTGGDSYYLLICSVNATPTASGGGTPSCSAGTQWAVSGLTASNATATAATTTAETASSLFSESSDWFAFICDDNVDTQRCANIIPAQQGSGNLASPFNVNDRPVFSAYTNDGPVDPDGTINFYSTTTDPNTGGDGGGQDQVKIIICSQSGFNTTTDECTGGAANTLASSTFMYPDAFASWTLTPPWIDDVYQAVPYVIDEHGHESIGSFQGTTTITFTINNVSPTVDSSQIDLNGGLDMRLTVEAGETTGFTLDFAVTDNNSCTASSTDPTVKEVTGYELTLYRDGTANSSSTCNFSGIGVYDPNDCYTSLLATTTWNLSCTASTTACSGDTDSTDAFSCTFPLWFIADPTDATSTAVQYEADNWKAQIRAVDDDNATGTASEDADGVEVESFLAFDLLSILIPYGSLAPGENTDDINGGTGLGTGGNTASSTMQATGNVGLDQRLSGQAMCETYVGPGTECPTSASSTIPDYSQVFTATSTITYATASSSGNQLSSTTPIELEINNPKSRSTSSPATSTTYWGINIPDTITLSGDYTGQNTFIAIVGESANW